MAGKTSIEWTHMPGYVGGVWNPTTGCTRISAGCDNCYAFALHDRRYKVNRDASRAFGDASVSETRRQQDEADDSDVRSLPFPRQYDLPFSHVQLLPDRLDVPLRTRKPTCYFVDSMSDLFHEDVPDEFIARVFLMMVFATWHRFLILTKRPERMRALLTVDLLTRRDLVPDGWAKDHLRYIDGEDLGRLMAGQIPYVWPAKNVWLGTSVEDQKAADERIPPLLATPTAVRFISAEPLLGPIDLGHAMPCGYYCDPSGDDFGGGHHDQHFWVPGLGASPLHWVIVGARADPARDRWTFSGPDRSLSSAARPGVAVFVKQLGSDPRHDSFHINDHGDEIADWMAPLRLRESHGRDMGEWPEDLRIREWPEAPR